MDDIIQNTLSGTIAAPQTPKALQVPDLSGNNQSDIKTLQGAQKQPSMLLNLQKAMQNASRTAYQERQALELSGLQDQFDPTKVSGGTFSGIIGNLEQNRGGDVSRIYQSTMGTYAKVQDTVTQRLQYLQELEQRKKEFDAQMKLEKEKLKELKKTNKQQYKIAKGEYAMKKKSWELEYTNAKNKLQYSISANDLFGGQLDQYRTEFNSRGTAPVFRVQDYIDNARDFDEVK